MFWGGLGKEAQLNRAREAPWGIVFQGVRAKSSYVIPMAGIAMLRKKRSMRADGGSVGRVYEELKRRAISFGFRPGERLNEVEIARQFGVSRTPLREALNRL